MRWLDSIRFFLRPLRSRAKVHRRLDDEVRFHLEMEEAKLLRQGVTPAEARRRARLAFGDVETWKEEVRDVDGVGPLERLAGDLAFGARLLRKNPGFTAVAVLTLGLGIGASTAIFSVVDGILLRGLPFPDSKELVSLWADYQERGGPLREWLSFPNFHDLRQESETLEAAAVFLDWGPALTGSGEAERLQGAQVSDGLLGSVLRVAPVLGRGFTAADDQPGADPVVLLGQGLWLRRFGGDTEVVGRTLTLDGEAHTVVGVLPRGFHQPFAPAAEIWRPLRWSEADHGGGRGSAILRGYGRLRDGADLAAARAEVEGLGFQLAEAYPENNAGVGFALFPLKDDVVSPAATGLWVLLTAVGATLLVVCVNLANLLLARGAARTGEITVRTALGASRGRIVRQLLTESVLLASLGGGLGMLLAVAGTELLVRLAPANTPRLDEVAVDGRVLTFAIGVSILCGLVFGLTPALETARADLRSSLPQTGRGGLGGSRLQTALVVSQVALALVLLVGAGLLVRSFQALARADLGYDPEGVVSAFLAWPPSRFQEISEVASQYAALEETLRALPGVEAVGGTSSLPLSGSNSDVDFNVEGRPLPPPGKESVVWIRRASPGYLDAMKISLLRGRGFDRRDGPDSLPVVIVNETMARRTFGTEEPVGRRINVNSQDSPVWREIVGVARDVKAFGLKGEPRQAMYVPFAQLPTRGMFLTVRSRTHPEAVLPLLRQEIAALDPTAAPQLTTMTAMVDDAVATDRFLTLLVSLFALVALQLAAVGLYGVVSYGVSRQRREIGLRMALGANRRVVGRWVVGRSLKASLAGVALGLLGALLLVRLLAGLLYETSPLDPVTFTTVALLMVAVATAASLLPALRAAKTDPVTALSAE